MAFVIDVGPVQRPARRRPVSDSPLTAKTISVLVATAFAFVANRHWTYRDRASDGLRPGDLPVLRDERGRPADLLGLPGVHATTCSGLDSQLADNISGNVIAVGLGTLFRFWVYRTWVFPSTRGPLVATAAERLGQPEPEPDPDLLASAASRRRAAACPASQATVPR